MHASPKNHGANLDYLLSQLFHIPLLSHEQELALARRIADGDENALREMVSANVRLVIRMAKPYRYYGIPFEDLVSEGLIGLIEAARRFDADHGNRFVTFAFWWIQKSVLTAVREQSRLVRVPSFQLRKEREIRCAAEEFERDYGGPANLDDLSEAMSLDRAELERILIRTTSEFSIDQLSSEEDDTPAANLLRDESSEDQELALLRVESQSLVQRALTELTPIERTVLERRFGLDDERPEVLRELGSRLNLSRERVRQIEVQATSHLKRILSRLERNGLRRHRPARYARPRPLGASPPAGASTLPPCA